MQVFGTSASKSINSYSAIGQAIAGDFFGVILKLSNFVDVILLECIMRLLSLFYAMNYIYTLTDYVCIHEGYQKAKIPTYMGNVSDNLVVIKMRWLRCNCLR